MMHREPRFISLTTVLNLLNFPCFPVQGTLLLYQRGHGAGGAEGGGGTPWTGIGGGVPRPGHDDDGGGVAASLHGRGWATICLQQG